MKAKNKVKTPAGRTIHLNHYISQSKAERNALNGPVQGGAGDCMKQALGNLYKDWDFSIPFGAVGYIHDEVILDVEETMAEEVARFTEHTLVETANKMFPNLQFRAAAHITNSWAGK